MCCLRLWLRGVTCGYGCRSLIVLSGKSSRCRAEWVRRNRRSSSRPYFPRVLRLIGFPPHGCFCSRRAMCGSSSVCRSFWLRRFVGLSGRLAHSLPPGLSVTALFKRWFPRSFVMPARGEGVTGDTARLGRSSCGDSGRAGRALQFHASPGPALMIGLAIFMVVFAINSAVHSYLILAYSEDDEVAINVGFYYMANAGGRLSAHSCPALFSSFMDLSAVSWSRAFWFWRRDCCHSNCPERGEFQMTANLKEAET